MKCLIGIDTYLVLEKPNRCQLAKIRSLVVSQVQLTHKGKSEIYLVDEEHKIILRKLDKQRSEECDLTYFTTDYPELMIVQNSQENSVKLLEMSTHADSLNLDLEFRLSEEFLHFQTKRMVQSSIHEVQKHLCTLGANSLHQLERSPIHPNALIRDRGDIIQEMQCQTSPPVQVIKDMINVLRNIYLCI